MWLEKIKELDKKVKFIREKDEKIGLHQKEGRLKIEMVYSRGDNRGSYYYCKCDCGKYTVLWGSHFRTEHTKSCGCYSKENRQKLMKNIQEKHNNFKKNIAGWQHDWLIAIEPTEERTKSQEVIWICRCTLCDQLCKKTVSEFQRTSTCGCSLISKGENKIKQILEQNKIKYVQQKTFSTCKAINVLRFDFYINNQYLIEFDGIQHFKPTTFGGEKDKYETNKKYDAIKNQWCKENNIPLIRIPYTHLNKLCLEDLLLGTSSFLVKI